MIRRVFVIGLIAASGCTAPQSTQVGLRAPEDLFVCGRYEWSSGFRVLLDGEAIGTRKEILVARDERSDAFFFPDDQFQRTIAQVRIVVRPFAACGGEDSNELACLQSFGPANRFVREMLPGERCDDTQTILSAQEGRLPYKKGGLQVP